MKHINKFIMKSLVFVFMLSMAAFTLVGCKKDNSEQLVGSTNIPTTENIVIDSEKDDTADNVGMITNNLHVICSYNKTPSFADLSYENKDAVLAFFNTRDMNGVFSCLAKQNFNTFIIDNFTYSSTNEYFISVSGSNENPTFTCFTQNEFGDFVKVDTEHFDFSFIKNIFVNEDGNHVLQIQYFYFDESGNKVETPLMVNVELEQVATFIIQ